MNAIANQSLFDIAIQESGSFLACFEWALKNGKSITDVLIPGEDLIDPESIYKNEDTLGYFKGKKQMFASDLTNHEIDEMEDGIGFMVLESTFIVQ